MIKKSPGYIKLQGQTKDSSDIPGVRDIRSASSMFMTREERESVKSAMDFRALGREAGRERDKFARQDATVEKFQKNYYKARERLAAKINKNRSLMELRRELQRDAEWEKTLTQEDATLKKPNRLLTREVLMR